MAMKETQQYLLTDQNLIGSIRDKVRGDFLVTSIAIVVPLTLCLVVYWMFPERIEVLFRDPVASARSGGLHHFKFYAGALSHFGIFLWTISAAVTLFSAASIVQFSHVSSKTLELLLSTGALSLLLMADDLFMFHEIVFPSLGIAEPVTYGTYALLICLYLFRNIATIAAGHITLVMATFGFFGVSVLSDIVLTHPDGIFLLVEDGAKLIGIFCWMTFAILESQKALVDGFSAQRRRAGYR
ncbi:MAG: hypothetical protein AAF950_07540 [Pseudomonadota bacterium]